MISPRRIQDDIFHINKLHNFFQWLNKCRYRVHEQKGPKIIDFLLENFVAIALPTAIFLLASLRQTLQILFMKPMGTF
jgi:hypothetical protein